MRFTAILSSLAFAGVMSFGISFASATTVSVSSQHGISTPTITTCPPRYC